MLERTNDEVVDAIRAHEIVDGQPLGHELLDQTAYAADGSYTPPSARRPRASSVTAAI
jgi:hypothetical protein